MPPYGSKDGDKEEGSLMAAEAYLWTSAIVRDNDENSVVDRIQGQINTVAQHQF